MFFFVLLGERAVIPEDEMFGPIDIFCVGCWMGGAWWFGLVVYFVVHEK
jgi:hypothetical protein